MIDDASINPSPLPQAAPETLSQAMTPEAWRERVMYIFNRAVEKDNLTVATQNQDMLARHLQYYAPGLPAHDAVKEISDSMMAETEALRAELEAQAKPEEPKPPRIPSRLRKPAGEKPTPEAWLAEMIDVYEEARAQDKIGAAQRTLDGIGRHLGYLGAQLKVAKILSRAEREAQLDKTLKAWGGDEGMKSMTFEKKVELVALIDSFEALDASMRKTSKNKGVFHKNSKYEECEKDEEDEEYTYTPEEILKIEQAYAEYKAHIEAQDQAQNAASSSVQPILEATKDPP